MEMLRDDEILRNTIPILESNFPQLKSLCKYALCIEQRIKYYQQNEGEPVDEGTDLFNRLHQELTFLENPGQIVLDIWTVENADYLFEALKYIFQRSRNTAGLPDWYIQFNKFVHNTIKFENLGGDITNILKMVAEYDVSKGNTIRIEGSSVFIRFCDHDALQYIQNAQNSLLPTNNAGSVGIFGRDPRVQQVPRQQDPQEEYKEGEEEQLQPQGIIEITMTQPEIENAEILYCYLKASAQYVEGSMSIGNNVIANMFILSSGHQKLSEQFPGVAIARPEAILEAAENGLKSGINPWHSVKNMLFRSLLDHNNQLPSWCNEFQRLIDLLTLEIFPNDKVPSTGDEFIFRLFNNEIFKRLGDFFFNQERSFSSHSVSVVVLRSHDFIPRMTTAVYGSDLYPAREHGLPQQLTSANAGQIPPPPLLELSPQPAQPPAPAPINSDPRNNVAPPQERGLVQDPAGIPGSSNTLPGANAGRPPRQGGLPPTMPPVDPDSTRHASPHSTNGKVGLGIASGTLGSIGFVAVFFELLPASLPIIAICVLLIGLGIALACSGRSQPTVPNNPSNEFTL